MTGLKFIAALRRSTRSIGTNCSLAAFGLLISVLLDGCGGLTKSEYQQPTLDIPGQWRDQHAILDTEMTSGNTIAQHKQWWRSFNDQQLDALIERALRSNNDLAAAGIAVYRARLQADLADTNLTPTVTSQINARSSPNSNDEVTHGWSTSTSAQYELDLWGRLARVRDAAAWEATATEYDRQAAALSLISTTATLYWRIAYLNELVASTEASIESARKTLELVQVRHTAGAVGESEASQARTHLASLQAVLPQHAQQREEARNALAILFDQSPAHRQMEAKTLTLMPMPALPAALPVDLLGRRPDLQAAESRLRESLSNADAKRLSYYPALSLSATVETGGTSLTDMLKNPISTLSSTLLLPFLQWHSADLTIKTSRAEFDAAALSFKQTFYKALAETQNAITARGQIAQTVAQRTTALHEARIAEGLAEVRYRAGKTSLQDWLDSQETRRQASDQLIKCVDQQYENQMALYLALGGDMAARQ